MRAFALSLLLSGAVFGQAPAPTPPSPPDPASEPSVLRVFQLEHSSAEEVAGTIHDLFEARGGLQVAVDQRSNTLIVAAREPVLSAIEEVLEKLDRDGGRKTRENVQVFKVRAEGEALERLAATIQRIVDLDAVAAPTSQTIVLRGDPEQLAQARALVGELDREPEGVSRADSFMMQIHCLLEDPEADDGPLLKFEGDEQVAKELRRLGVGEVGMLFKAFSRVSAGSEFEVAGTARGGATVQLGGEAEDDGDTVALEIRMLMEFPLEEDVEEADPFELNTTVRVPLGHQLVIGSTPLEGKSVLLVLRIDRADDAGRTPGRTKAKARTPR